MILVILAIYNEEKSIRQLVKNLRHSLKNDEYKIIAVDDGSSDDSLRILTELKGEDIIIAQHKVNLSIGAVFSTGFNVAIQEARNDDDVVVLMESDQTSDIELLKRLIDEIRINGSDIAIASRYIKNGGYLNFPLTRKIYSKLANSILKKYFPIANVSDYTIFYRSYRVSCLKKVMDFFGAYNFIHFRGFVSNSELLIKAACFTGKISEIPFKYDYGNKEGKSKLLVLNNILEYFYFIFSMKKMVGALKKVPKE